MNTSWVGKKKAQNTGESLNAERKEVKPRQAKTKNSLTKTQSHMNAVTAENGWSKTAYRR